MPKPVFNPDLYHGHRRRRNFFEGWYFKLVDANQEEVFAFIPGLIKGKKAEHSHSFIHLIDGSKAFMHYLKLPVEEFSAARDKFAVKVADSSFSLQSLELNVDEPEFSVQGQLAFSRVSKWPDSFLSPGSMGPYNFLPRMQCYSQVCAMDMALSGQLTANGRTVNLDGGRGYVEKNWGSAFPYSWIWVQANSFPSPASISCSLGHIPMPLGTSFRGFLIGLMVEDEFFEFTTANRSKVHIQLSGADIVLQAMNKKYLLTMATATREESFITLLGPRDGQMVPLLQENLQGRVSVKLQRRGDNKILFQETSNCAGIECGGDQMLVLDQ